MPSDREDGGSAFASRYGEGMSMRDYFAIHCDQPGVLEIVSAAGLRSEDNFWVIDADGEKQKFNTWYDTLSQRERFELQAKVRYQLADAMIAVRKESPR